jgi:hypothetical protein
MDGGYNFPDEFASPATKESDQYGLQYIQAAYHATNRYGCRLFYDDLDYDALVELAQGRQSVDKLYKHFGFGQDPNAKNDQNGSLAWIDIQVLNLAPKYINRAVAKIQRYKYDIALTAVDPISVNEAKEYNAAIKTFYEMREWFRSMNIDAQQFFPFDVKLLPEYPEELMFNITVNEKLRKIIDAEKSLKLLHAINNTSEQKRLFNWDTVVIGRGHMHCYLDENNVPRIERINPKYWFGSYVEGEDFSKAEYQGFIDFITPQQFRKESEGKLSREEIDRVINSYSLENSAVNYGGGNINRDPAKFDGLKYIPVARFYFLSNDQRAFEVWKNNYDNDMIEERDYEYNIPARRSAKYGGRVIRNTYTSVYGGTWVIDSDIIYDYRRLEMPRLNLVNQRLPIITFAPGMKEGRVVSMAAQMTEPLYMINVCHNKIKDIAAKGRMGILELDFNAMENVALGQGGTKWDPYDVMKLFLQSNILVKRQTLSQYGQALGKAIQEVSGGLTMTDYFNIMKTYILFLDDLTASTVVEGQNMPDRMTSEVMRANVEAGAEGIEYLVNADMNAYEQASHILLLLLQQAKKNKVTIQGMIPALGEYTTEFFEVPDDIAYCEYGLVMDRQPSEQEWAAFYFELMEAVKANKINSSDSAFIRTIKNMKMARQILANRERINEAKMTAMNEREKQFQMDIAKQSTEGQAQADMMRLDKEKQDKMELMALQAKIDEALLIKKAELDGEITRTSDAVKLQLGKQQGIDTILKEAMRSRSEDYKSDKKFTSDVIKTRQQAETAIKTAEMSKKEPVKKSA